MNIMQHAKLLLDRMAAHFTGAPDDVPIPEGAPAAALAWHRMVRLARATGNAHAALGDAIRTYATLAASNTRAVFALVCDGQRALSLYIGLDASRADAAMRGIRALQQGMTEPCGAPPLPDHAVFGLDAAALSDEGVALDAVMDAMPPDTALLLVLDPLAPTQLQQLAAHIDKRRSELSALTQITLQDASSTSHTTGSSQGTVTTTSKGTGTSTGSNTNSARVIMRTNSDGNTSGASILSINRGRNHQTSRGANVVSGSGESRQHSVNDSTSTAASTGASTGDTRGDSCSEQTSVRIAPFAEKDLSLGIVRKRLRRGMRHGMMKAAYYIIAEPRAAATLAAMIQAALASAPSQASADDDQAASFSRLYDEEIRSLLQGCHPAGRGRPCLAHEVASVFPLLDHPGLPVTLRPLFGQNVPRTAQGIPIGHVLLQSGDPGCRAFIDAQALTEHVCAIGPSGVGKSNALRVLLQGVNALMPDAGLTVIDPKNEWLPSDLGSGARLFCARADGTAGEVLRINPFAVYGSASVQSHVDHLIRILCGVWPLYAAMEAILRQALVRSYEYCGWDLPLNVRVPLHRRPLWPDWSVISRMTREVVRQNHFSERNERDYIAALCTRMDELRINTAAEIFVQDDRALTPEALFGAKTVIHLQTLSHTDLPLVMSMLALMLREYSAETARGQRNLSLRRLVVFEEAHNIIPNAPVSDDPESVSVTGAAARAVVSMTKELRSQGTGLVLANQSFLDIDGDAVNNCGTKFLFSQGNSRDISEAEACVALGEDKAFCLSRLNRGECIVYQRSWTTEPVLVRFDKAPERAAGVHYTPDAICAWKTQAVLLLLDPAVTVASAPWQRLLQAADVPADLRRLCLNRLAAMTGLDQDKRYQAVHELLGILTGRLLGILPFPGADADEVRLRYYFKQLIDGCHAYMNMRAFSDEQRRQLACLLTYPHMMAATEDECAVLHACIRTAA